MNDLEIMPRDVKQRLDRGEELLLVDVNWLREQGVKSAKSMAGGIDRWSVEVDPKVPRY